MEMLAGGVMLVVAAALSGQMADFSPSAVSSRSVLALVYLITGGSLLGFTAYIWLLTVTTPARVATYAYVNPVVAVILGWAFAGEPITSRIVLASFIIAIAVALVTVSRPRLALDKVQEAGPGTLEPSRAARTTQFSSSTVQPRPAGRSPVQ
jgi:drug/metabolite transporter (DMT)-like permease